eukprot:14018801-Ditylum_brightwellii.AAC.1
MSISGEEDESLENNFSIDQELWYILIKSSMMMLLNGDREDSSRMGHEMEKVYTMTLVEDSTKGAICSIDLFIKSFIVSYLLQ